MIFEVDIAFENWQSKYQYGNEVPLQTYTRQALGIADVQVNYDNTKTIEEFADEYLKTILKFEPADIMYKSGTMPIINIFGSVVNDVEPWAKEKGQAIYLDPHGDFWQPVGIKFTMGGRITANIGTNYDKATLMNCYIAPPVKDANVSYKIQLVDGTEIDCSYSTDKTSDDLSNIFLTILEQAQTLKSEGGYGINFGFIRPRSSAIKGVGIQHPGVVSYMEIWNRVSQVIVRGNSDGYKDKIENHLETDGEYDITMKTNARKGAMMAVLPVWHPDIEEFVQCKVDDDDRDLFDKFNISVAIDDAFMEAVENDELYDLEFKGEVHKRIRARELFDLITECTYNKNDPGVIFVENAQKNNSMLYMGPYMSTNPCGEIPGSTYFDLHHKYSPFIQKWIDKFKEDTGYDYEEVSGFSTVCLLGSFNLTQYVNDDRSFDWDRYEKDVKLAAVMLENINDIGNCPLPHYEWALKNVRQYGMGSNGIHSAMLMMGLKYNEQEALDFIEKVSECKENWTLSTSALLAKERGPAPVFSEDMFETYWWNNAELWDETRQHISEYGLRNMKTTTNPPLGNSSQICGGVSNSGDPIFSLEYDRTIIADEWPEGLNRENIKEKFPRQIKYGKPIWEGTYEGVRCYYEPHNRGLCVVKTVQDYGYRWLLENYPEDVENEADYLITAYDLEVQDHIDFQEVMTKYCNQSVSRTINVPEDYPREDFNKVYMQAWKKGLIGVTTYRAGTMESVMSQGGDSIKLIRLLDDCGAIEGADITEEGVIRSQVKLPSKFVNGDSQIVKREGNKYYVHFSYLPNDRDKKCPVALWIITNNFGRGEWVTLRRAINALYSLMREKQIDEDLIEAHIGKVGEDDWATKFGKAVSMCLRHNVDITQIVSTIEEIEGDYIATTLTAVRKFMKQQIEDGTLANKKCPDCGSEAVIYEAGCDRCLDCGSSGCN